MMNKIRNTYSGSAAQAYESVKLALQDINDGWRELSWQKKTLAIIATGLLAGAIITDACGEERRPYESPRGLSALESTIDSYQA